MEIGTGRIGSCSKEHQKIYQEWFNFADSDNDGRITGSDAIKFFGISNLSRQDLKQVWATADSKRQGYLGFKEFVFAMQLVSLAQDGREISHDLLNGDVDFENVKPPVMEGLDTLIMKKKQSSKSSGPDSNGGSSAGSTPLQTSPAAQWFSSKSSKKISLSSVTSIIDGLKRLYIQKLKPLEVTYCFNDFVSPLLRNSDFDAKPMVMLLGQYSTGKTTFIKHLLKSSYPGAHIGPEPTTDRFVVVMVLQNFCSVIISLMCRELMKEVFPKILLLSKQTCHSVVSLLLERSNTKLLQRRTLLHQQPSGPNKKGQ